MIDTVLDGFFPLELVGRAVFSNFESRVISFCKNWFSEGEIPPCIMVPNSKYV